MTRDFFGSALAVLQALLAPLWRRSNEHHPALGDALVSALTALLAVAALTAVLVLYEPAAPPPYFPSVQRMLDEAEP